MAALEIVLLLGGGAVVVRPVVCQAHVNSQLSYCDKNDHSIHIPSDGNKRRVSPCGNNSFFFSLSPYERLVRYKNTAYQILIGKTE